MHCIWIKMQASGERQVTFWPCDKAPQGDKGRKVNMVIWQVAFWEKGTNRMTSKRQSSEKGRKGRKLL